MDEPSKPIRGRAIGIEKTSLDAEETKAFLEFVRKADEARRNGTAKRIVVRRLPTRMILSEAEIFKALDGLSAYDCGAFDSGIHDEALKRALVLQLNAMDSTERRPIARSPC